MGLFSITPEKAAQRLEKAVVKLGRKKAIRNAVLHVDSPRTGLRGTWATGVAHQSDGSAMRPETPFISASVGKIAMAATAFHLAADGKIDLDGSILDWIPRDTITGLEVVGGEDGLARVTPRMLSANRSGLADYFDSKVHPPLGGAMSVMEVMIAEPERAWTREQLIAYTIEHYGPYGAPGEKFLYSDLNWDLLGLVFEGACRRPFHEVVRQHVLDPLRMSRTWYHAFERYPEGIERYADVFARDVNLAGKPCMTVDQAGGGLATTAEDMARLIRGLENGTPVGLDVIGSDWTEDAMSRGLDYGYGTWRWRPGRIFFLMWRYPNLIGVSGSNNTFAYITDHGDVIAGTMNQTDDPSRQVRFLLMDVVPVLKSTRANAQAAVGRSLADKGSLP
jgi:D-alanyl-D-alanine carboxypeptidase